MMGYSLTPGIRGICPEGWHLPTAYEFQVLIGLLGGYSVAGGKLKETGFDHWLAPNDGATNESGFTGLGAGYRGYSGYFSNFNANGVFWSSSAQDEAYAECIYLDYLNPVVVGAQPGVSGIGMSTGHSVRCLKD